MDSRETCPLGATRRYLRGLLEEENPLEACWRDGVFIMLLLYRPLLEASRLTSCATFSIDETHLGGFICYYAHTEDRAPHQRTNSL